MAFNYWAVIVLDTKELWKACLTEEAANTKAKRLIDSSGYDVVVENVELTENQLISIINDAIDMRHTNEYEYTVDFGLPEGYFELKEHEEAEKEIEELAKFVKIISDMDNE